MQQEQASEASQWYKSKILSEHLPADNKEDPLNFAIKVYSLVCKKQLETKHLIFRVENKLSNSHRHN